MSLIKSKIMSQIESKTVTIETADADDGYHGGRSDASMVRIVLQQCYRGNHDAAEMHGPVDVAIDVVVDVACT